MKSVLGFLSKAGFVLLVVLMFVVLLPTFTIASLVLLAGITVGASSAAYRHGVYKGRTAFREIVTGE